MQGKYLVLEFAKVANLPAASDEIANRSLYGQSGVSDYSHIVTRRRRRPGRAARQSCDVQIRAASR